MTKKVKDLETNSRKPASSFNNRIFLYSPKSELFMREREDDASPFNVQTVLFYVKQDSDNHTFDRRVYGKG